MFDIKVVVLCGGRGLRLNELTQDIPKSMIMIKGRPVLWHICTHFQSFGFNEFIFCLGYKGEMIKDYFKHEDFKIKYSTGQVDATKTERLMLVEDLIKDKEFFLTYGDDLCDVDLNKLLELHKSRDKIATLTAVKMPCEFGILKFRKNIVTRFQEKPDLDQYINGGYYVLLDIIFSAIKLNGALEEKVLPHLAVVGQLIAYKHTGFWKSINTLKDVKELNQNGLP